MINIRIAIKQALEEYHSRVHYQRAPSDIIFPYVVYDFPNSFMNGDQEVFNLDVDIWDNKNDTTELETLASNIWREFNKYHYLDDNIQFSIYRDNRLPPLDEDDKNIKRRKLIFQLRFFDRQL